MRKLLAAPVTLAFLSCSALNVADEPESEVVTTKVVVPVMVSIPTGTFTMGDQTGKGFSEEKPTHQVTISAFNMSKYEITQAEYLSVMNRNPASSVGMDKPVETVSWYDAVIYCMVLSEKEGKANCYDTTAGRPNWKCDITKKGYRLPTEAEWEYACKGETTGDYYGAVDDIGWHYQNSGSSTRTVGLKISNNFGLHDISGNVGEWCNDWYGKYSSTAESDPTGPSVGTSRISRGGGCRDGAHNLRSSFRFWGNPEYKAYDLGFRIVLP